MLLFDNALSGNCYKVRLLLHMLQIGYERRELDVVDRSNRAAVLGGLNPDLRVPTLVLDDGRPLAESGAILWYFGADRFVPSDPYERAQVLQWMFFEQYSVEPNIAVARFWVAIKGNWPSEAELEARLDGGRTALAALEAHLTERRFLVAERFTLADIAVYGYTHVAGEAGLSLKPYPALRRWFAAVQAQPRWVPMVG